MTLVEPGDSGTDDYKLSALQGLDAVIRFLEAYREYNRSSPDVIGGLLNLLYYSMVDDEGEPNTGDPRMWSDWLEAIDQALSEPRVQDNDGG